MKKLVFDESMGAAGDMIAAALLDLFDNPEEVVNEINKIIEDSNLEEVVTEVVQKVRNNVEGLEFNVDIKGEEEMSEDYNHFDPEHRRFDERSKRHHHFEEHHHPHHREFEERFFRPEKGCKPRPPFGMMPIPNINIEGPIELHIDLFFGDAKIVKPERKKRRHHHHHHKHHSKCRDRRSRKAKVVKKKTSSMHVGKDHLN